jgi:hypothetical protein
MIASVQTVLRLPSTAVLWWATDGQKPRVRESMR